MKYVLLTEDETPLMTRYLAACTHRNAIVVASPCRFPHIYHGLYLLLTPKGQKAWIALWSTCLDQFENVDRVALSIFIRTLTDFFENKCIIPQVLAHNSVDLYSDKCKGVEAFCTAMEASPFGESDLSYAKVLARARQLSQHLESTLQARLYAALKPVVDERRESFQPIVFQGAAGMRGLCEALQTLKTIGGTDTLIVGQHSMGPLPANWAGNKPFNLVERQKTLNAPDTGHNTTIRGSRGYHGRYYKQLEEARRLRTVLSVAMCSKYDDLVITRYSGLTSRVPSAEPLRWNLPGGVQRNAPFIVEPGDIPKWRHKLACNVFSRCSTFAHDLKLAWMLTRASLPLQYVTAINMVCVSGIVKVGSSPYGDTTVPDALFHTGFVMSEAVSDLRGKQMSTVTDNYIHRPKQFDKAFRKDFREGTAYESARPLALYVGDMGFGHLGYAVKAIVTGLKVNAAAVPQDCDDDMALDFLDILHDRLF